MKYEPENLEEINFHKPIVKQLKEYIENKDFPNILLYGPPGTGKTTIATCFSKSYLKKDFKQNFLGLNASNQRGINTIRNQVIDFVTHKPFNKSLKIMLLDQADYLTLDAQAALRRILEKYYNNARFILTCNYLNRIEPPIHSRCKIFKFKYLDYLEMQEVIKTLTKIKGIDLDTEIKNKLITNSRGDIRYIINNLDSKEIQDPLYIKKVLAHYFSEILKNLDIKLVTILSDWYIDIKNLVQEIFNWVWKSNLKVSKKIECIQAVCKFQENVLLGCNIKTQFLNLSNRLRLICNNPV